MMAYPKPFNISQRQNEIALKTTAAINTAPIKIAFIVLLLISYQCMTGDSASMDEV